MAKPTQDILSLGGNIDLGFIGDILDEIQEWEESAAEEIMSWFGIEDEIVLTASVISKQLFPISTVRKEAIIGLLNASMADSCNQKKNLLGPMKQRNAEANAKMNKPYYLAENQTWDGFDVHSNLVGLIVDTAEIKPIVESTTGLSPITIITSKKKYPHKEEVYWYRLLHDASQNYLGDDLVRHSDGRYFYIENIRNTPINKVKANGRNSYTTFTRTVVTETTTITSNGEIPPITVTYTTTIVTRTLVTRATQAHGQSKTGYSTISDSSTSISRPTEAGDVAGTVTISDSETTVNDTTLITFPVYNLMEAKSYVTTHFTYNGREFVELLGFDDLPDSAATRIAIDELEMMPLIRLREGTANVNGISDARYEAYTAAHANGSYCIDNTAEEAPSCSVPESTVPAETSSNYGRYVSTNAVLRGLGMTLDLATNMVCGGQEDLDKISGGYIRFAINPLAQKVKPGVVGPGGTVLKIDDATAAQKQYINGTAHATFEFFKTMADSEEFPAVPPVSFELMSNVYYYGFTVGTFNSSVNIRHIADTIYAEATTDDFPINHVSMSVNRTENSLTVIKQLSSHVRRKLVILDIVGVTVIRRKVPENEDGSGPLVDAVDTVSATLKTDSESILLFPLSIDFSRELSANDKLELFFSGAYLQIYASQATYLEYYETEDFADFIKIVLVIVTIIITIVTWGAGWWIGPLIGAFLAGGGYLYADHVQKKMEEENKRLEEELARLAAKFKDAFKGSATDDMNNLVLTLTDIVGIILQDLDTNIGMDYNQIFSIALGDVQYKNDMLYKDKYSLYCETQSRIRFKTPVSKQE